MTDKTIEARLDRIEGRLDDLEDTIMKWHAEPAGDRVKDAFQTLANGMTCVLRDALQDLHGIEPSPPDDAPPQTDMPEGAVSIGDGYITNEFAEHLEAAIAQHEADPASSIDVTDMTPEEIIKFLSEPRDAAPQTDEDWWQITDPRTRHIIAASLHRGDRVIDLDRFIDAAPREPSTEQKE